MAETTDPRARNPNIAYERSDWHIGAIGVTLLGIFLFLVIAPVVLILAYPRAVSDVSRRLTVEAPPPGLQTNPAQDLANFEAAQNKALNDYYWIDKQNGVVHIPIEQAMKKLARDGIDGFPKAAP